MSVTPRRSWPTNEGALSQGGSDSQRAHPSAGNIQQQTHHGNRQMNMPPHNNTASQMESSAQKSSSHAHGTLKAPPVMAPQQQQQATHQQHQQQQQQQQPMPPQQVRPLLNTAPNNLPSASGSLFSPSSGSSLPMASMADNQHQSNLFVNGQSDMTQQPGSYSASAHNMTHVKSENLQAASQYDFPSHPMNDFDQHQKDLMQMPSDNLFNAIAQQNHTQLPVHQQSLENKPLPHAVSSPAMSMPVSGGKPKSSSAAMAQVRNASSWSSLAGPSQQGGPPGSSKSSNIGDSFQMFKRQAKEKEARQKALIEQQEMRRQAKEQAERERMRAEADRRREREEEEALEKARYVKTKHCFTKEKDQIPLHPYIYLYFPGESLSVCRMKLVRRLQRRLDLVQFKALLRHHFLP